MITEWQYSIEEIYYLKLFTNMLIYQWHVRMEWKLYFYKCYRETQTEIWAGEYDWRMEGLDNWLLQHAGHFPGSEEPHKSQSHSHRLTSVQTPLQYHRDDAHCLQSHCDNQTVCWESHRLCPHQRHTRGCPKHLLLDPLHLHSEVSVQQNRGKRSSIQRCW